MINLPSTHSCSMSVSMAATRSPTDRAPNTKSPIKRTFPQCLWMWQPRENRRAWNLARIHRGAFWPTAFPWIKAGGMMRKGHYYYLLPHLLPNNAPLSTECRLPIECVLYSKDRLTPKTLENICSQMGTSFCSIWHFTTWWKFKVLTSRTQIWCHLSSTERAVMFKLNRRQGLPHLRWLHLHNGGLDSG